MWEENGALGTRLARAIIWLLVAVCAVALVVAAGTGQPAVAIAAARWLVWVLGVFVLPFALAGLALMAVFLGVQHLIGRWRRR